MICKGKVVFLDRGREGVPAFVNCATLRGKISWQEICYVIYIAFGMLIILPYSKIFNPPPHPLIVFIK